MTHYDLTSLYYLKRKENCARILHFPCAGSVSCANLRSGSEQKRSPPPVTFGCFKSRHINNGTSWGESRLPSCLASCRSFCLTWQTQCVLPSFLLLLLLLLLHSSTPITPSSPSRPPSLPPSRIRQPSWSKPRRGSKKWDDKEEMINDNAATKGPCGSGTYTVDKSAPLTCR